MKHFTRETLKVDEADNKVQLTAFKAGLRSRDLVASPAKYPPKTMVEMLLKAQKYINAKNALAAIKDVDKPRDKGRKDDERGVKRGSTQIVGIMTGTKEKKIKVLGL